MYSLIMMPFLPDPWPSELSPPFKVRTEDGFVLVQSFIENNHGRLLFTLDGGESNVYALSKRLSFTDAPALAFPLLIVVRDKKFYKILVGDLSILDPSGNNKESLVIGGIKRADGELSTSDPNASTKCKAWIESRKKWFNSSKAFGSNQPLKRRELSKQELTKQLSDAAKNLRHQLNLVRQGNPELLVEIANMLRKLLYRTNSRGIYDPLLIRLAAMHDMPLPVFAFANSPPPSGIFEDDSYVGKATKVWISNEPIGITHLYKAQQLTDIEEYLQRTAQELEGESMSYGELIKILGDTVGKHFDPTVPLTIGARTDILPLHALHPLLLIGYAVADVAEYVVNSAA
jgi:hypothetical protein